MKRIFILTIVLLLTVSTGIASAKNLKLGSMSPLTGPYAADGNDIKNGVLTAIEVIQAEGGIPGYAGITLSAQDTACDPRQAVAAANKLLNEEVAAVVGAYCSSSTLPASEVLDEEDIVMITPASTNEKVTERGLKYMFRTCGRDDDQSKAAVAFMKDYLGAKSVFLVDDKTAYSQGLADNVAKGAKGAGIKVAGHEHVNQGDKDYSAVIAKVKAAGSDVLYISLQNSASGADFVVQAKRAGIDAKMMGQDAVYHPQLIQNAKKDAEGMFLTFGFVDTEAPAYKKFMRFYEPKYGQPGAYSAYAYDSAMAYLTAVKKAGSTNPEKVRKALLDLKMDGASKVIDYVDNGDSSSNYIVRSVKGGEFVNYWNPTTGKKY